MGITIGALGVRGPAYIRELRGRSSRKDAVRDRTILLVSEPANASDEALAHTVGTARRQHSSMCVLHVMRGEQQAPADSVLRSAHALGELLTAAVLRAGEGSLPRTVTIMVYVGGRDDLLDLVTGSIEPTLIIAAQTRPEGKSSDLAESIGRAQGCPVLLVPTTDAAGRDLQGLHVASVRDQTLN
jgi:hypothetical protein